MSQILQSKLETVRRKQVVVALATGAFAAAAAFVIALAVTMLLDFWLNLSFTARAALLAVNLAVVVWLLLYSVFAPVLYGPDDDEIALMVEDAEPAFRTRLIASIQLGRPSAAPAGASASLIRAMVAQAESLAGPMDFGRVIKTDKLTRVAVLALLALVVVGGTFAWAGESGRTLLQRALFLSDVAVPRKTAVTSLTGSTLVAKGDAIEVYVLATGAYPGDGTRTLYLKTLPQDKSASRKQEVALDPVQLDDEKLAAVRAAIENSGRPDDDVARLKGRVKPDSYVFVARLENLQDGFEYTVRLNDGDSARHTVKVLPRPAITRIEARQVLPAYTGRTAPTTRPMGDLSLLRGSKLQLSIAVNKALRGPTAARPVPNFVHLIGANQDVALAVDPANNALLSGEVPLPKGTTGFSINLTDTDGLRSKDPAVYRVDLIEDKAPAVRILVPNRKEVVAVAEANQRVVFQAVDDFAIGSAAIKYKVDDGPEAAIPLALPAGRAAPKTFNGEYAWRLGEIRATAKPVTVTQPDGTTTTRTYGEGSVVEYWVEVDDTRDAANGGPNKGQSEHYMIRVGSKEEVQQILRARMADIGSALHSATDDQESVAGRVQTILLERKNEPGGATGATTAPAPK